MIHNRKDRIAAKRAGWTQEARAILEQMAAGTLDCWEGYRQVYGVWVSSSGLTEDLRPLFILPDIDPEGCMSVDDSVREKLRFTASLWLSKNSNLT